MKYQSNRASCGPAALHNALAALGVSRSEDELIKLCGQNANGTSGAGIVKAIKALKLEGMTGEPIKFRHENDAMIGLWWYLTERGRPVILCVDKFEHWVACTGYLGYRFAVMDSADNRLAIYYTGNALAARWAGPKGQFHAIVV